MLKCSEILALRQSRRTLVRLNLLKSIYGHILLIKYYKTFWGEIIRSYILRYRLIYVLLIAVVY